MNCVHLNNGWRVSNESGDLHLTNGSEKGNYSIRYRADASSLVAFLFTLTNFVLPKQTREGDGTAPFKGKHFKGKGILLNLLGGSVEGQHGGEVPTHIKKGAKVNFTVYADGHVEVSRFLTTIDIPVTELHEWIQLE